VEQLAGEAYTKLGLYTRGRGIFKKNATDTEDMGDSDFHWVDDGDLIISGQFAWEGSVAMARREHNNSVVSHRYPILNGRKGEVLSDYLFAYFLTSHGGMVLNDCSRGSAGRNRPLNMNLLMNWKIPVPSIEAQERIASLVVRREKFEVLQKKSVALLQERRIALITAAVTGKIDLRDNA
jgi:type I restriction enzyme S subunit